MMKTINSSFGASAHDIAGALPDEEALVPILLVDGRDENLLALESELRNPGYQLFKASSGDEALRLLLDELPALILMEVQMPQLNGYETASIIKNNSRTREVPIIFITATNTDERDLKRSHDYGAIDYIYRHFDPEILRSKVAVLAELYRKTKRLARTEKALRESELRDRERKIAELELRLLRREQFEQNRYRNLVESIDQGIVWTAKPDTLDLTFASSSAAHLTGHASEALLAEPGLFLKLIDEQDREKFLAAARKSVEVCGEARLEHRLQTAAGTIAWFKTRIRAIARTDGYGFELSGLSFDITALKNAERRLAHSRRRSDTLSHASLLLANSLESDDPLRSLLSYLQDKSFSYCALEAFDSVPAFQAIATGLPERDTRLLDLFVRHPSQHQETVRKGWASGRRRIWRNILPSDLIEITGNKIRGAALEDLGLRACIQLGLTMRGRLLGVLTFGLDASRSLSEEDVSLAEDIAYRISAALENSSLYQKAESAIRLRDEFLSIASHELRTPLTPLKIRVQQMQRLLEGKSGTFPIEQLNKTVDTCHRQIERLSKLVDDLLDISRISRGKLSLHSESFDLSELIKDIIRCFGGQLESAGCTVNMSLESPLEVSLDMSRVEQVIVNVLTNAIKYAPGKPIEITARSNGKEVEIAVSDHGIGIALEDQTRIFQRFERAVSSNHFGGLGLGLYIVSQILAAHGGNIVVSSEPGMGANFKVNLPRRLAESRQKLESTG